MSKFCALILLCTLPLLSCNKLPKETTSGKNTFGCRIDGKVWKAYVENWIANPRADLEYRGGSFTINAMRQVGEHRERMRLELSDGNGVRTHTYKGVAEGFYATYFREDGDTTATFSSNLPGGDASITITRVTPPPAPEGKAIVSGTFSFTATNALTGETVEVTDGRFDAKER